MKTQAPFSLTMEAEANATDIYGIIVAAGQSRRMGGKSKIWMSFQGRPVLEWTLRRFRAAGVFKGVVAAQPCDHDAIQGLAASLGMAMRPVAGGAERYLSVREGLRELREAQSDDIILIHDAARFLVPHDLIERVITAAIAMGAAVPVVEVVDTVKAVSSDGLVERTVPRRELGLAQTPQGFQKAVIEEAYRQWAWERVPTDDAEVAESAGFPVRAVAGDRLNQKLTRLEDIGWFDAMLKGLMEHEAGTGI